MRIFAVALPIILVMAGTSNAPAADFESTGDYPAFTEYASLSGFPPNAGYATPSAPEPVHVLRFTDYRSGPVKDWLKRKGFVFAKDAEHPDLVRLKPDTRGLVIEAKSKALGVMLNEKVTVENFSAVEIDWGVEGFPAGASYEKGVLNEAVAVQFFLGEERVPSGAMFVPDTPYFISLFLCRNDKVGHPYVGNYFKEAGRYVCADRPDRGQLVTSRFNLRDAYRDYFGKWDDTNPKVTGVGLSLDTRDSADGGKSRAFVREIRFYR